MTSTPRISIGMPVYNGAQFLRESLESLLQQTFTDFEIIVCDNASDDQTPEIVTTYAQHDPRIRYHRHATNIGAIANFNFAVTLAKASFFKWQAADDVCHPEFLQCCLDRLDEQSEAVWAHTGSDMIDAHGLSWLERMRSDDEEIEIVAGKKRRWKGWPRDNFADVSSARRFAGVLLGTRWCVDSYGLIRTEALKKTGLLKPIYGSEKVLMAALSLQGTMAYTPQCLFSQRVHDGASSAAHTANSQHAYALARGRKTSLSVRWALLCAHYDSIRNARLSWREHLSCLLVLVRYVLQIGKWRRVLQSTWKGYGVGGGGKRLMESANSQPPAAG